MNLGKDFAQKLGGGEVVLLYGELGSGKTQFAKGIAEGLGIEERITSPTFTFIKQYKTSSKNLSFLYHVDLYRIENKVELSTLGLEDAFGDEKGVVLIEWADRLQNVPKDAFVVRLKYEKGDARVIEIN